MSTDQIHELQIEIPNGVNVQVEEGRIKVTGPRGSLSEDLRHIPVVLSKDNDTIRISKRWPKRKDKAMVGTAAARIRNLIKGVTDGFVYKLKIVYAHFPTTVKVLEKERKVVIENFSGERTPRVARIVDGASVRVQGDEIIVEGSSLNAVSQTAANIQKSTRIKEKDQRVFLDGIYIYEKEA